MLLQVVCPSVTLRYSVEMAKHILKLFLPSGSHTILVCPYVTAIFLTNAGEN